MDDDGSLLQKKQEFLQSFFKKGAEFTRELLAENDKLRKRLVSLEEELGRAARPRPSERTLEELASRLHDLEAERRQLMERFDAADRYDHQLSERYEEIECENNDLASLFVAQTQMHSTLDVGEVVRVILEILLNFVGARRFAILMVDGSGDLRVLATEGFVVGDMPNIVAGEGVIGRTLAGGPLFIEPEAATVTRDPSTEEPTIAFALRESGRVVGLIAVWSFLVQKELVAELDRRIFDLLSSGGGQALEAARLASRARAGQEPLAIGTYEEYSALLAGAY